MEDPEGFFGEKLAPTPGQNGLPEPFVVRG